MEWQEEFVLDGLWQYFRKNIAIYLDTECSCPASKEDLINCCYGMGHKRIQNYKEVL